MSDGLLREQIDYYRARTPEYDQWFLRQGRYDLGADANARWQAELDEVVAALDRFGPRGRVLELAGGTGWWTQRLARTADQLTVVDASPEVIERNRAKVADPRVSYIQADIFDWQPEGRHDVVFFAYWLSHDGVTATRRLNDGREFRIYKLYYEPAALAERLAELGFRASVQATETYFVYGEVARAG